LWPDFDPNAPAFDPKDALRRTARSKVQKVISRLTAMSLQIQLDIQEANEKLKKGGKNSA
jgi:hypothetical protein